MTREEQEFNVMLAVFSVAAGMVGVCLTGIGLLQVASSLRKIGTLTDEMLATNAFFFLGCCFASFMALRSRAELPRKRWAKLADSLFFVGLTLTVVICALVVAAFV